MAVAEADSTWRKPGKGAGLMAGLAAIWEIERARLVVWSPLLLVIGIWTYFNLRQEPHSWVGWLLVAAFLFVVFRARHQKLLLLLTLIGLGFGAAKLRTDAVETPLLRAYSPDATVTAFVADIEKRGRGSFVLIVDTVSSSLPADEQPKRLRLTWRGKKILPPTVGDQVKITADLSPLPRPASPGAFDYGRQLYFDSIGAVGRVRTLERLGSAFPFRFQLRAAFHDLRTAIGERIRASIPGPLGAVAEALVTGERASIPRAMNESLQASGLFHVLSISGLHMSLVAGGAFWVFRAALALSPALALKYPIKKYAAAAALIVGLLYMLLADGGAATERAFLMIAVMFFAILVDRPAISLHNLAIAALVILVWQPEQAVSASFQMSFLAVMGLAAFYPYWTMAEQRFWPQRNRGVMTIWARRLILLFLASLITSLVAGTLSGIAAAHHFGRVAPFGVVANALALPVTGIAVMPMAMLAVLLMPFGLEQVPLSVMAKGLELMMVISDWVASWKHANAALPLLPVTTAVCAALAAAFVCLPSTILRLVSVVWIGLALWSYNAPSPTLLIDERGGNVALVTASGLVPARFDQAQQSVSRWLDQFGDEVSAKEAAQRAGWICTPTVCRADAGGVSIAYAKRENELIRSCPRVDVLIAAYPLRRRCKGKQTTIDRFDVWRRGAHAVYVSASAVNVVASRGLQGNRPWTYEPRARSKSPTGKPP